MDLKQFLTQLKQQLKPPYKKKPPRIGLEPYDSHRQRERYGRQHARQLIKAAQREKRVTRVDLQG